MARESTVAGARFESAASGFELLLLRLAAAVIDQAVLFFPTLLISAPVIGAVLGPNPTIAQMLALGPSDPKWWMLILSTWVPHWAYASMLESSSMMGTVGKRLCRIRVTDARGNRLSFGRASLRFWSKMVSSLPFMLGYVVAVFTRGRRALHDVIAGTSVVRGP